jgi:hypothetical protein
VAPCAQAVANAKADICAIQPRYVVQITGDNAEGKAQLDHFIAFDVGIDLWNVEQCAGADLEHQIGEGDAHAQPALMGQQRGPPSGDCGHIDAPKAGHLGRSAQTVHHALADGSAHGCQRPPLRCHSSH